MMLDLLPKSSFRVSLTPLVTVSFSFSFSFSFSYITFVQPLLLLRPLLPFLLFELPVQYIMLLLPFPGKLETIASPCSIFSFPCTAI